MALPGGRPTYIGSWGCCARPTTRGSVPVAIGREEDAGVDSVDFAGGKPLRNLGRNEEVSATILKKRVVTFLHCCKPLIIRKLAALTICTSPPRFSNAYLIIRLM